jgi:hypothetical protein
MAVGSRAGPAAIGVLGEAPAADDALGAPAGDTR